MQSKHYHDIQSWQALCHQVACKIYTLPYHILIQSSSYSLCKPQRHKGHKEDLEFFVLFVVLKLLLYILFTKTSTRTILDSSLEHRNQDEVTESRLHNQYQE